MSAAVLVAVLVAAGVYLILQRGLVRVAFGFVLIGHAANVVILAAGGMNRREAAYVGDDAAPAETMTDPLLHAFALTAIVITFALTVYMLALAGHGGDDDGAASDAADESAGPTELGDTAEAFDRESDNPPATASSTGRHANES